MNDEQDLDFKKLKDLRTTASLVRYFISGIVALLGGTFTLAKISGIPVIAISSDNWSRFFMQTALIIYFWAWVFGSRSDLKAQEGATRQLLVPKKRIYNLLFWCIGLIILFIVMWRVNSFKLFSIALFGFLSLDAVLSHLYYRRILRRHFIDSLEKSLRRGNIVEALEIEIVDTYMKGSWRQWRYIFGFSWIIFFFVMDVTGIVTNYVHLSHIFSADSFLSFSALMYVIIMESWIWAYRIKRESQKLIIKALPEGYIITKTESKKSSPFRH